MRAAGRGSSAPIRSTSGIPSASILPDPVDDFAIHAPAGDRVADRGALDRERPADPGSGQGADDGARDAKISERFC
jgi:hypothetical protein